MLWIGSGRFDGRIGDGNGPRTCRGPDAGIEAHGKVRPGVPTGTRVEKPQAQLPVAHNYDRKSLQRSASLSVSESL